MHHVRKLWQLAVVHISWVFGC